MKPICAASVRLFWWLPLYVVALYWLALQVDKTQMDLPAHWQLPLQLDQANPQHYTSVLPASVKTLQDPALLIMTVSQNVAVYYPDGTLAGTGGSMQPPVARNRHRPLLFHLYQPALQPGQRLHFAVVSTRSDTLKLAQVYLGSASELEPIWQRNQWLRQGVVKVTITLLLVTALLIGSLWLVYPSKREYLWYAIGTSLWAAHTSNLVIRSNPVGSDALWAAIVPSLIGLSLLAFITMMYYYLIAIQLKTPHNHRRVLYAWLGLLLFALPLFILPYETGARFQYTIVWYSLLTAIFSLTLAYIIWLYWQQQNFNRLLFILSGVAMLVFGIHDARLTMNPDLQGIYVLHFAAMLTLLSQYSLLVRRFAHSLRASQFYATHLEALVTAREQELQAQYQQIRLMEQGQIVLAERERIMRDIHDGFGGHLVSTLAMLEQPDANPEHIKQNLQDALTDLRLVIDSLDFDSQDITTALGMLRNRISRKIRQAGFELRWQVQDITMPTEWGAEKILQLLRIVQEAITNALKHSGGNCITVSTWQLEDSQQIIVQIQDNGFGMADSVSKGKGLISMHKRADKLAARLEISNQANGSGVSVRITLDPAALKLPLSSDNSAVTALA